MNKKILYVATSDIHIATFHLPYLEWLAEQGIEIHLAVKNKENIKFPLITKIFDLDFPRSPFSTKIFTSYQDLKKIISEGHYNIIHCHTPIPSTLSRLAARHERKKGTKVLYTSHGFHFYKGSPIFNWLVYYPIEYLLSKHTDAVITINKEDYNYVKNKMKHKDAHQIKGIGVNTKKFRTIRDNEKLLLKKELGFNTNDFLLLYVAEFIPRKNHAFLIDSMPELVKKFPKIKLIFVGKGILMEEMKKKRDQLKLNDNIIFFGFRYDVEKFASIADIGVSSSIHEGLGLGLAEEMLCSIPIVATLDRGHREMVVNGYNGYLFEQGNHNEFIKFISEIYKKENLRKIFGQNAYEKAQEFTIENSLSSMAKIYKKYLNY